MFIEGETDGSHGNKGIFVGIAACQNHDKSNFL